MSMAMDCGFPARSQKDIGMSSRTSIAALAAALVGAASFLAAPLLAQTEPPRATPDRAIAGAGDARAAVPSKRRVSSVDESAEKQPAADKAATSARSSK
jgi:hypothetical protein